VQVVHGPDAAVVLRLDRVDVPPAFGEVPLQAAQQPDVVVSVHEDAQVEAVTQAGHGEQEDSLHDHHRTGIDLPEQGPAGVGREVILGAGGGAASLQGAQVTEQEVVLQRVGLVEVDQGALGRR